MLKNIKSVLILLCIQISVLMGHVRDQVSNSFLYVKTELWLLVLKIRMYRVYCTESGIYIYKLPYDKDGDTSSR